MTMENSALNYRLLGATGCGSACGGGGCGGCGG
jgi:hypothetical protein